MSLRHRAGDLGYGSALLTDQDPLPLIVKHPPAGVLPFVGVCGMSPTRCLLLLVVMLLFFGGGNAVGLNEAVGDSSEDKLLEVESIDDDLFLDASEELDVENDDSLKDKSATQESSEGLSDDDIDDFLSDI